MTQVLNARRPEKRSIRITLRSKMLLAFAIPLLIVASITLTAYLSNQQLIENTMWVEHTHEVITRTEIVLSLLKDIESGGRGYALTGDEKFLEPYNTGSNELKGVLDELTLMTADNPNQQRRLKTLVPLIDQRIALTNKVIAARRAGHLPKTGENAIPYYEGKQLMDSIRVVIGEMNEEENNLLKERRARVDASTRRFHLLIVGGGISSIITILVVGLVLGKNVGSSISALMRAAHELHGGNYGYRVQINIRDETRSLAEAFNRMAGHLEISYEALRESEERFRNIIDNAGVVISLKDTLGRMILVNRKWEETFGHKLSEVRGKTAYDFLSREMADSVHKAEMVVVHSGEEMQDEMTISIAGGDHIFHSLWFPLRDSSGKISAVARIATDVTNQKKLEKELRESEAQIRSITQSVTDAIVSADGHGKIIYFNRAAERIFGFSAPEAIGQPLTILMPNNYHDAHQKGLNRFIATGESHVIGKSVELQGRNRDGQEFPVSLSLSAWQAKGETFFTGVIRDITEQKKAEEAVAQLNVNLQQRYAELQESNAELEAFTYSVSHDLRAPLRHINGFCKILEEESGSALNEVGRNSLSRIQHGAKHMGQLVDDLLTLSQVGRHEMVSQVAGLKTIVQKVMQDIQSQTKDRRIEWKIGDLPFLECDPGLIEQVFVNLLSNAVKYTRPREQAVIEVGQLIEDGKVIVFIRDNGVGFSMKYSEKLFGIFQRLHRQEDFEGTGVGLATVHRIIRKHGGRIWAEAELDRGATFYFTLGLMNTEKSMNSKRTGVPPGGGYGNQ